MFKFRNGDLLTSKRSKRRQNKDRVGCMAGIISVFDFRHGRINRELLSAHRTHMTESMMGPSYPTSEVDSLTDSEEMHLQIESLNGEKFETRHTRVKEHMEEEMQGDETSDLEHNSPIKNYDKVEKPEVLSQKPPPYCDLEDLMNDLLLIHKKRDEEQKPTSLERSNSLENERRNATSDEPAVTRKNRNFFRRRSKSHECISLDSPLPFNEHNERRVSQFSLTEIRKKLKISIRRSPRDSECREKPVFDEWSSPNRDCFHSERFSQITNRFKSQDWGSGLCKSERKQWENMEFGDTSDRISNIYVEAKKHLSDMLNNGDEDTEFMEHRHSRTLGKLLSFPDYDSLPSDSLPKNELGYCENSPNESQSLIADDKHQEHEVSSGIVQILRPSSPEDLEVLYASDLTEEDELSCSPMASPSGSSLSTSKKTEEFESTSIDKACKPSPVSVLEPLFSEDDVSPARTISRSETSIKPLRIPFEEPKTQETWIRNQVENEESAFEYVEAVLLASDLNWGEFEKRWLSSIQILNPSLYDELRIFSSRPGHDQRLLFDSTNEILKEICDQFFGFFPEFGKRNVHWLPMGVKLIEKIWGRIESRLDGPYPRSLDGLISKDLEVPRMWIDLRLETREIAVEMEEWIFEDMIDDVVWSLMDD